uniref:NADH-ubiquinone oxidoreductase chain 6 n=1 Tax=Gasteruption parvicollarium TaxID=1738629 RepID=A0A2S0AYE3_9HYME|nr:NADH dehydrogenase subunit 6 [Gasteruption parvicollarium]ALJ93748.1 NADH dehydrogenase subunit 6 [Gasteruption parvicollarium]
MNTDFNLIKYFLSLLPLLFLTFIMMSPKKMFSNNPLLLSMILCLLTIMYSIHLSLFMSSYWFSMIVFLMMIGGLLILFLYFTSISPNEFINFSKFTLISFLMKILLSMMIIYLINLFFINKFNLINMWKISNEFIMNLIKKNNYNFSSSNFIYNYPINKITMFIILYLFYTLFIINKLCLNMKKPMRKFNN